MKTLAFQIDEATVERLKNHLADLKEMEGRKITQREFVLNAIAKALDTPLPKREETGGQTVDESAQEPDEDAPAQEQPDMD